MYVGTYMRTNPKKTGTHLRTGGTPLVSVWGSLSTEDMPDAGELLIDHGTNNGHADRRQFFMEGFHRAILV
jgi:hypothetical protein